MADDGEGDRRTLLRAAAVVAGAAATTPLLGKAATARADGGGADALFKAGKFEQASLGSIAGSGPRVVGVNFGGKGGESAAVVFGETAEQLQIRTDEDRPIGTFTQGHPAVTYPCYPKEIRLGDAVAKEVYCETNPNAAIAPFGFDAPASFFHCFHKPYNVTLDFTDMNLYIARGKAA
ncbi:hypothetical protein [Thermomonospora umbrina]|uniref:Uncharacterized protein n=1 Tax=Thermomonospora umbrina TaxID=111806 RepID=A0A3D9T6I1_9ACTN|nr:hypothetical protein [Thermomonospora umbrina]REF00836.1 hypothetical protein DFJ69_6430 [Thermomonospora umbrina]